MNGGYPNDNVITVRVITELRGIDFRNEKKINYKMFTGATII